MKKLWLLPLLALCLCFVSCGNVKDTDGFIGNEAAEKMEQGSEMIKDGVEDIKDEVNDMKDDVKDKVDDMVNAEVDVASTPRLTTDQAKLAAVSDAGIAMKDAKFYKTYLHNEDGREYYDVEFSYGGTEYDFEIDAYTGAILKREEESDR